VTHAAPRIAIDLVLMTIADGALAALLANRVPGEAWALPGGHLDETESLDGAARRILETEARMPEGYMEQLYTFGGAEGMAVAYFALLPVQAFAKALKAAPHLALAELAVPWSGETGGAVAANTEEGEPLVLAPGHPDILGLAVKRLRGKLDYSRVGFALLPSEFTLRQLQDVHEAILGVKLNKPAFRRRTLDKGWIEGTGARETGASFRPAELYREIKGG
jgi:8-oxo-dGTP diphosphatase